MNKKSNLSKHLGFAFLVFCILVSFSGNYPLSVLLSTILWCIFYLPAKIIAFKEQQEYSKILKKERQIELAAKELELQRIENDLKRHKDELRDTPKNDEWGNF